MTTTHDPASPVAAALADAEQADILAAYPLPTQSVRRAHELRDMAMLLAAHIRTLAARDAEQTARIVALTEELEQEVARRNAIRPVVEDDLRALLADASDDDGD